MESVQAETTKEQRGSKAEERGRAGGQEDLQAEVEAMTTGISRLDELLDQESYSSQAAILTCVRLCQEGADFADKLIARLAAGLKVIEEAPVRSGLDAECDVLPAREWLSFLEGYTAGTSESEHSLATAVEPETSEREAESIALEAEPSEPQAGVFERGPGSLFQIVLTKVMRELEAGTVRFRKEVLTAAISEVSEITGKADLLIAMEAEVRKIYDNLGPKAKIAITALQELTRVASHSVGVDYGNEILFETFGNMESIEQAERELPEDPDVAILAEVHSLAHSINEAN